MPARAGRWRAHRGSACAAALEREAWDGDWYRRGYFDDGTPLGSARKRRMPDRFDRAVLGGALRRGRSGARRAGDGRASSAHLIRRDDGLALLFTPPFDTTPLDPGYIKGYPPGLRENGGQYTPRRHVGGPRLREARATATRPRELLLAAQPDQPRRARRRTSQRYKVEPYVVAADVYSVPPHVGRGGWTWYTGSAGWMYRAGIEGILGIRLQGDSLLLDPGIPTAWPGFELTYNTAPPATTSPSRTRSASAAASQASC